MIKPFTLAYIHKPFVISVMKVVMLINGLLHISGTGNGISTKWAASMKNAALCPVRA
jgi:hypothetical protein